MIDMFAVTVGVNAVMMTRSHALFELHVFVSCPDKTICIAKRVSCCHTQQTTSFTTTSSQQVCCMQIPATALGCTRHCVYEQNQLLSLLFQLMREGLEQLSTTLSLRPAGQQPSTAAIKPCHRGT